MMQTQPIATNPTYTPPPIQCRECHQIKPQNEFWDVPDRLCQMCWEDECDRGWWEAVKDLEPTGYPDEYRRVAREDHGEVEG